MLSTLRRIFCPPKLKLGFFTHNGKEYDVVELVHRAGPTEVISTRQLLWILDEEVWEDECDIPITPRAVLRTPHKYPHHYERILEANLGYPILVYTDPDGLTGIADGCHRLCKSVLRKQQGILARYVELS